MLLWHSNRLRRFRQGLLVDLLVLVQWNLLNLHRYGRHHVRWFLVEDEVVHSLNVHLLIADDVGCNELTAVLIVKGLYGSVLDARELANDGLYLLKFDAETANLHLTISAAYKLDIARWQVAYNIASAIGAGVFSVYS